MNAMVRLARAEVRKLVTTRAMPVSFGIALMLTFVSVIVDAQLAGHKGVPPLGTDASVYKMLSLGAVTCIVMLITGILSAGGEFRHRTIVPALLAAPHRARLFAVKVLVIAVLGTFFSAVIFGFGLGAVVVELSAHQIHHLPAGIGSLYLGTVVSTACFGMIGVALGALTRNTVGAIVVAIAWVLFVEQVILHAIVPAIEKWLPTAAAISMTSAPGASDALSPAAGGLVLAGYATVMLIAASRTSMRRDIA